MSFIVRTFSVSSCAIVALMVTGCGVSTVSDSTSSPVSRASIAGKVHGGQQPVTGASIQLYAASATANMGASTALLAQPVTTDGGGNFSITGDYTCPAANPLLYIVATGGNPGLPGNQTNPGIAEMSLLGSCNDLVANASTTFIFIDELTTAVGVQALAPFMADYAHIGSAPSSISGVGGAFVTATSQIDFTTGEYAYGGGLDLPEETYSTVADILAACINTAGGSSACSTLYSDTGGTTNTIAADLQIVKNPGQNTSQLYSLISANPPFQPYFTSVPSDFTATVGYTVPGFLQGGTLDSNGHIWLYLGGYNYDTASDTSTDSPGYVQVYDNNFSPLFTVQPGTGGLYYPSGFARDTHGHVFALNANNTISEFDSNGAALTPSPFSTGIPSTFSPSGPGNNYINNTDLEGGIQVDAQGNIWGGIGSSSGQGNCYFELNSGGANITPSNSSFCSTVGVSGGVDATDGSGNAWALGSNAIAKVDAQGNLAAMAPESPGCFSSSGSTLGIAYDHVHNQLWGYSELGAGAITDAGAALFCDDGSTVLPVIPQHSTSSTTPGDPYSGGSLLLDSVALDGAGNLWFVTGGINETGVVGSGTDTFTGTASYSSYLSELSSSGTVLTPYNASNNSYGLQPTGFGTIVTASATNAFKDGFGISVFLLGIDPFGNIWAEDIQSSKLLKITGLASPNLINY